MKFGCGSKIYSGGSYVEPAIIWSNITSTVNLAVPIAVSREIKTSGWDESQGITTRGGLADFLILAGYTHRF